MSSISDITRVDVRPSPPVAQPSSGTITDPVLQKKVKQGMKWARSNKKADHHDQQNIIKKVNHLAEELCNGHHFSAVVRLALVMCNMTMGPLKQQALIKITRNLMRADRPDDVLTIALKITPLRGAIKFDTLTKITKMLFNQRYMGHVQQIQESVSTNPAPQSQTVLEAIASWPLPQSQGPVPSAMPNDSTQPQSKLFVDTLYCMTCMDRIKKESFNKCRMTTQKFPKNGAFDTITITPTTIEWTHQTPNNRHTYHLDSHAKTFTRNQQKEPAQSIQKMAAALRKMNDSLNKGRAEFFEEVR